MYKIGDMVKFWDDREKNNVVGYVTDITIVSGQPDKQISLYIDGHNGVKYLMFTDEVEIQE